MILTIIGLITLATTLAFIVESALYRRGTIFRFTVGALLRKNLFMRILEWLGARALPGSPDEVIAWVVLPNHCHRGVSLVCPTQIHQDSRYVGGGLHGG